MNTDASTETLPQCREGNGIPGIPTPLGTDFACLPSPEAMQVGGKEFILLVEDEAFVRAPAAEALESAGYRVVLAENAVQALALYRHCFNALNLLLSDVVMPGMSGRELASTLASSCPKVRVLLMSGYADQLSTLQGNDYPNQHLLKPFSTSTLLRRVREVLDKDPMESGGVA